MSPRSRRRSPLLFAVAVGLTLAAAPAQAQDWLPSAIGQQTSVRTSHSETGRLAVELLAGGVGGLAGGVLGYYLGLAATAGTGHWGFLNSHVPGMILGSTAGVMLAGALFGTQGSFWISLLGATAGGLLAGLVHLFVLPGSLPYLFLVGAPIGAVIGSRLSTPSQDPPLRSRVRAAAGEHLFQARWRF